MLEALVSLVRVLVFVWVIRGLEFCVLFFRFIRSRVGVGDSLVLCR